MVRSLTEGAPVVIDDRTPWLAGGDRDALRFAGTATRGYLPLVHEGVPLGMLRLDYRSPRVVPDDEREVSHAIAAQVAATLGAIRRQAAFRRSATIDELTGTLRRQYVRARLDAMLAGDAGASRALVLARLDGIPGINAGQGFLAGDRLLRSVANRLRRLAGLSATIGRWNGTEFVIVLTGDDIGRVTGLVGATAPALADGSPALPGGVTLRMGIALAPTDGQTVDALLGAALATMPPLPTPVVAPVKTAPGTVRDTAPLPSALTGLVRELDHHDQVGLVHAELVATLASRFATSLGLSPDQVEAIAIAGQVLDIGKLLVPAAVLRKAGPLTANERRLVQQHVALGCQMISGVAHEGMVLAAIGSHHEWWDGTGYPRRVTGDAIPLGGRILALADATAAMAMDKPYRRGRPVQDIVTELCRGAGTQFDPDLVEPFVVQLHLAANAGILGTVLVQPGPNGTGDLSRLVAV
ncbi:MAG: diguanylate cyclase [Chloroflexota bacterium]|nr:diguanylate cyclase [Chloroflexota bacterium]